MKNINTSFHKLLPSTVTEVARRVAGKIGKEQVKLVGGVVRDFFLKGKEAKPRDFDFEIFKVKDLETLESILTDCGFEPKVVGQAFGICKVKHEGLEFDFSLPRLDNHTAIGHKSIEVVFIPNSSIEEAARRRAETFSTMAMSPFTGEVLNPFNGVEDLRARIIRHTCPVLWPQDPVRLLRIAGFIARFGFDVDPKTTELAKSVVPWIAKLPKERSWEELVKIFKKGFHIRKAFAWLNEIGLVDTWPEIKMLQSTDQNPDHHPEGNVWIHSLLAADAAMTVRDHLPQVLPEHKECARPLDYRLAFGLGVFLHDLGKVTHTITREMIAQNHEIVQKFGRGRPAEKMLLSAHGHDWAGQDPAEIFLRRFTDNKKLIKAVRGMVGLHMHPFSLADGEAKKGGYMRFANKAHGYGITLRTMGFISMCDACGTSHDWKSRCVFGGKPNWEHLSSAKVFEFADKFEKDSNALKPLLKGRDLIMAGIKPGPQFGKILKLAMDHQYANPTIGKDELLKLVLPR